MSVAPTPGRGIDIDMRIALLRMSTAPLPLIGIVVPATAIEPARPNSAEPAFAVVSAAFATGSIELPLLGASRTTTIATIAQAPPNAPRTRQVMPPKVRPDRCYCQ